MKVGDLYVNKDTDEVVKVTKVGEDFIYYEYENGSGEGQCLKKYLLSEFKPVVLVIGKRRRTK